MTDPRLKAVYDAASFLFVKKGYANTQVSEIAEAAGIATGTTYSLFAGKRAILHYVVLGTLDKDHLNKEMSLPIEEVEPESIILRLAQIGDDLFSQIDLLKDGAPTQSFAEMLSSLFDCTASYQVAFNIINDNKPALAEVEAVYRRYVNRLHRVVENNLARYIERGEVRPIELPELHVGTIIEGIIWWAMYLPHRVPHITVPTAKRISLDILLHAYTPR